MGGGVDKEGSLREVSLMRFVALGMCYVNEAPQLWYVCLCVHLTDCTQERKLHWTPCCDSHRTPWLPTSYRDVNVKVCVDVWNEEMTAGGGIVFLNPLQTQQPSKRPAAAAPIKYKFLSNWLTSLVDNVTIWVRVKGGMRVFQRCT